jgi:hypothetical protein
MVAEMTLLQWFLLGFFVYIMYKLFVVPGANKQIMKKSRGAPPLLLGLGVPAIIALVTTGALAIPYFTRNMYEIFFPPAREAIPIWVWVIIGFLVLIVVKVLTSRPQPVYVQ